MLIINLDLGKNGPLDARGFDGVALEVYGNGLAERIDREATRERLAELINDRNVVLVTGGARGITAEVTKSLIQRTGARFLILARQPRIEPWIEALPQLATNNVSSSSMTRRP